MDAGKLEELLFKQYERLHDKLAEAKARVKNKTVETKARVKDKLRTIKEVSSYMRSIYFTDQFMVTYIPSRFFHASLWMLAPVATYKFQQLGLDPIQIQTVTTIGQVASAIYGPINGIVTDKLKSESYWTTAADRIMRYAWEAAQTVAPDSNTYTRMSVISGIYAGELDWENKFGMTVHRGKLISTAKQIFKLMNAGMMITFGYIGASMYNAYGIYPLLASTAIMAATGITGYMMGSRKYKDYWERKKTDGVTPTGPSPRMPAPAYSERSQQTELPASK